MVWALAALACMTLAQTLVMWRLSARVKSAERIDRRLSHFAEALALLTDTTEAGLASVAIELQQAFRRKATPPATRSVTGRRIATAARRGHSLEQIGVTEGISESEVRLHLEMTPAMRKGKANGAVRV